MKPPWPPHNLRARNRDFRGRGDELVALDQTLRDGKQATITHASIFSLGGLGKTALALEYAHRALERGEYPGGVWWIHAGGKPVDVLASFAPVLRRHGMVDAQQGPFWEEPRADEIAGTVRLALQWQRAPSLLVLDDVSEPGWAQHLPAGEVRVLVTTRDESLALGPPRQLEVLPPAQAREVAEAIAGEAQGEAEATAQQRVLVTALGGLALAVDIAARAVTAWFHGSWIAYERALGEEMDRVLTDPELQGEYGRGVFAAIELSIERCSRDAPWRPSMNTLIDMCDRDARAVLERVATFAPDAMPLASAPRDGSINTHLAWGRVPALVNKLGLVTLDAEAGLMLLHRLVERQVRRRAEAEGGDARRTARWRGPRSAEWWRMRAMAAEPMGTGMEAVDARRECLLQALYAANREGKQVGWISIAEQLASHLRGRARKAEALVLLQLALAKAEQLVPPQPSRVAASLWTLGLQLKDLGDTAGAMRLLERALGIDETTFGPEDPSVAHRLSLLASVLRDMGDAAGAKPLLERALRIDEKAFGPEDERVSWSLQALARLLKDLGDVAGAKPLLERALGIDEKTFGPEDRGLAWSLWNLALVLKDLGDAAGAKPLVERALSILSNIFEPYDPSRARWRSEMKQALKDLEGAAGAKPR